MRITDLLKACSVELNGTPQTKEETIKQMVALMEKGGNVTDVEKYKAGVFAREEEGTTGIGEGIAIPHAKTDAVNAPGLAAMVIPAGVDYDALDGQPVDLVFLIAAPNTEDNVHLEVLSRLSMLLLHARPGSPTHIWRQRVWKIQQKSWVIRSKLRQMVRVAIKMS